MFDIQNLYRAGSAAEAVALLENNPGSKLVAGGTDVLVKLRHLSDKFRSLVDIHGLEELKTVSQDGSRLFLGAGFTFSDAIHSDLVRTYIPVLAEACATVAGPQIRNMGTIGGNIANGATSADTAAPMLVLEPVLVILGPQGERRSPMAGFHTGPGKVALEASEVLMGFEFDLDKLKNLKASYYKYAMRSAMDIATIGCCAAVAMDGGRVGELRLAFTVAAPTPIRCRAAEAAALNKTLNESSLAEITKALDEDIKPRTSWRASKEFRTRIIKALAERMIISAAEKAKRGN